jgi:iron complex transport system permease protein
MMFKAPAPRPSPAGGWGLLLLLLASLFLAAWIGQGGLTPRETWNALRHGPYGQDNLDRILWSLRLPEILMAALVGASLAAAGVAFQALLRNDLADPYVIGVSAGASVGTEAVLIAQGEAYLAGLGVPLAAFASAAAAMLIVYALARRGGRVPVTSLLLAGVVISSFLGGVSTLLLLLGPPQDTQFILGRLMGTFQTAYDPISAHLTSEAWQPFQKSAVLALFLVAGMLILSAEARAMNLFALGEESAQQLGVEAEQFKVVLIITGSLLTAATVAFAGIIGFVGLISPHIARRLARTPDHRGVLPLAALCGAVLMVWADTIARNVFSDGRELPVGIVTAFLGAPFFIYLLRRQQKQS